MPSPSRCCGHALQVIPLRAAAAGPAIELLRCRSCTRSRWRQGGSEISRSEALEALGQSPVAAAEAATPPPGRVRRASAPPTVTTAGTAAPSRAAELRELLAGWQVLGS